MAGRARWESASATERATPAPNTSASGSELLARRFAPCTPVHATSPAAHRPGTRACREDSAARSAEKRPRGWSRPLGRLGFSGLN